MRTSRDKELCILVQLRRGSPWTIHAAREKGAETAFDTRKRTWINNKAPSREGAGPLKAVAHA